MSTAAKEILQELVASCARTHGRRIPIAGGNYGVLWEGLNLETVVAVRKLEIPFLESLAEAAAEGRP